MYYNPLKKLSWRDLIMKKIKILLSILTFCASLAPMTIAFEPDAEEKMQIILASQTKTHQKNVGIFLAELTPYLKTADYLPLVAKYLVFYIYTLHPRGISMDERTQIIKFFEESLQSHLDPIVRNDFFNALQRAPEDYNETIKKSTSPLVVSSPHSERIS